LIGDIACSLIFSVGFKPSSKAGFLGTISVQDIIYVIVCIEVDHLLIWEMNRETIDSRGLGMHSELVDVPAGFNRSNITCINILLDLIYVLIKDFDCGPVMALVDVLVDVLDSLNRGTDLNIDVTVVSEINSQ